MAKNNNYKNNASSRVYRRTRNTASKRYHDTIIKTILGALSEDGKKLVVRNYKYLVDPTWDQLDDQVASIIAAMPMIIDFPVPLVMLQLLKGPAFVGDFGDFNINAIATRLLRFYPEECEKFVNYMRVHKHCPEKYKTDCMLLICCLSAMIDDEDFNVVGHSDVKVLAMLDVWLAKSREVWDGVEMTPIV